MYTPIGYTYIWMRVCRENKLYAIYRISEAILDMDDDRHELGSWSWCL